MVTRALLLAVLLCGCGEAYSPESVVEGLRVLGVRADPPEIRPGESTTLTALLVDPTRPGKPNTVLWLGCDPDPFNLGRSACSDSTALQDPSALFATGKLPTGIKVIGLNDFATYSADPGLFDVLPKDDARRVSGTVGQVLAIAIGEEIIGVPTPEQLAPLFARIQKKEVQSVLVLFRVKISEAPTRNTNPIISTFKLANEPQFPGARIQLLPAEQVHISVEAPDASFEPYVSTSPTSTMDVVEKLTSAWYATSGRFDTSRIALRSDVTATYTAAGSPDHPLDTVPARRTGTFYVTLRDSRGGQTWTERPFFICDPLLLPPKVTAVRSPATRADLVVVEGRNLANVLDVVVGGGALEQGAFNATTGNWEAVIPGSLTSGEYLVRVHGKECSRVQTLLSVKVP